MRLGLAPVPLDHLAAGAPPALGFDESPQAESDSFRPAGDDASFDEGVNFIGQSLIKAGDELCDAFSIPGTNTRGASARAVVDDTGTAVAPNTS